MRRTVLGRMLEWPLILAPTGMTRMFHPAGERAVATEAARQGIGYALSTMATTSIEDVASTSNGAKIFQLYLFNDDKRNIDMIDRCAAAKFDALCVTVDCVWAGNRERDLRNGLTIPPRLTLDSMLQFMSRPVWCARYLVSENVTLPNVGDSEKDLSTLSAYFAAKMERHISWDRIERLVQHWGRPFAIKGLQALDDIRSAASVGCSAVILSNHGGRQLNGTPPIIDLVANVADAMGDRIEIIADGGIRRGTHILKALAMGADACMLGRPYLYALSAFGQQGVARFLKLLKGEVERSLALLGCATLDAVGREQIGPSDGIPNCFINARPIERSSQLKVINQ
jgi:L-lactate dehydrogenase (cytochrome)